jgi:hypothetical protein
MRRVAVSQLHYSATPWQDTRSVSYSQLHCEDTHEKVCFGFALPADSVRARKSVLAATAAYCHANLEQVSRYPWERIVAARRTFDRG